MVEGGGGRGSGFTLQKGVENVLVMLNGNGGGGGEGGS